ncbi:DNA-binding protein [Endozoicomonas sp. Mp262]|uniref:FitA-like ribbon-helix-helix domain-containing protein n=1 Tax=Endozoicomonas sp. Mp262 TaxID=2919499 RepID=UPI0021D814AD
MANLIVRNIEKDIVDALKAQAGKNGRSAEAEHRQILKMALLAPKKRSFAEVLQDIPDVGNDSDFARVQDQAGSDQDVFD